MYVKPELWLVNDAQAVILDIGGGPKPDNDNEFDAGVKEGHLIALD